jgi:hypothetical protein
MARRRYPAGHQVSARRSLRNLTAASSALLIFLSANDASAESTPNPPLSKFGTRVDKEKGLLYVDAVTSNRVEPISDARTRPPKTKVIYETTAVCEKDGPVSDESRGECPPTPCRTVAGASGELMREQVYRIDRETQETTIEPGRAYCRVPTLTRAQVDERVLREVRSTRAPGLRVRTDPAGMTLVHYETLFRVTPPPPRNLGRVVGSDVKVWFTPLSYRWSFGDGTSMTSNKPSVWHSYGATGLMPSTVTTTYRISYSLDGGSRRTITQTLTRRGPVEPVQVWQVRTQLVAPPE